MTTATAAETAARPTGQFLAMGETLIDFIVADDAQDLSAASLFSARPGGAPANVAVALARLGLPAAFVGTVGQDPFGERLVAALAAERVDVTRMRRDPSPTTLAFAWKTPAGDGQFWLVRSADLQLSPTTLGQAEISELAALIVGSVALAGEPSRSAIFQAVSLSRAAEVPVVFDVNLRPTLWSDFQEALQACRTVAADCSVLKLSVDDAVGLFGPGLNLPAILDKTRTLAATAHIVLTDGERGVWFGAGSAIHHVPAWPVAAIEPTGAGDAFTAALVKRLAGKGWTAPTAADISYAAAAGALATTRQGAWDGLPTEQELDAFLH